MASMKARIDWDRAAGLLFVLAAHAVALYGLWSYRILPTPADALTVFVNFINPPPPPLEPPKPAPPKPVKLEKPRAVEPVRPQQLVVEAPVISPAEPVAPAPPKEPAPAVVAAPPAPPSKPAGPVTLANELSVACPDRVAPVYPAGSRRFAEQGRVVVRVELDERGMVIKAEVATGSGSSRLDDAALVAVRQWRCNPAMRGGVAVKAVALQPFNFILEGR
jgi:protein TonB